MITHPVCAVALQRLSPSGALASLGPFRKTLRRVAFTPLVDACSRQRFVSPRFELAADLPEKHPSWL